MWTLHFRLSVNRLDSVALVICTSEMVSPAMLAPWSVTIVLMVATNWARSGKQGSRYQGKFVCNKNCVCVCVCVCMCMCWQHKQTYYKIVGTNSVALVRERTIPTEGPPLVGEVSVNFCG
jgi:hypothetical protein